MLAILFLASKNRKKFSRKLMGEKSVNRRCWRNLQRATCSNFSIVQTQIPQCGKCRNFLLLRFYVKSKLAIYSIKNCYFSSFRHWIVIFMTFYTFEGWMKSTYQNTKFRGPKLTKLASLELLNSPKLISRKIW